MVKTRLFACCSIALLGLAGHSPALAQARDIKVVNYTCNLEGAPAELVAQVETVRPAGIFMGSGGQFGGAIDSGEVNYYYQGTLTSASARYSFTGENQYADFVDMTNNERFRVQFVVQGQQLLLIANPIGPGPRQYLCQQAGNAAASMGGGAAQPGVPQGPQGGYPGQAPSQQGGAAGGVDLDQLMKAERQELGVQPTKQLHAGAMHGPTPASIPGGQVVTTKGLVTLVRDRPMPYVMLDALGGPEVLPGAVPAAWAAQAGSLDDKVQQAFVQLLQQRTGGNKQMPLVVYCLSRECWLSYNAALRAIAAGYTNVLWYRGGLEAWKLAGLPTEAGQQAAQAQ
ncbi:MAG: rhodanese-like domain-containing protein [Steroidobacteraceae bacterium]